MNNKTKLLSLTASILMIVSAASIGSIINADASHAKTHPYSSGTIQFKCERSLNYLDDSSANTCTEITKAAAIWTKSITNIDFTKASSNYEVKVKAGLPKSQSVAENQNTLLGNYTISSEVTFSLLKKFGDGNNWWHQIQKRHDTESIALHEFGHSLGLTHDATSPLMKTTSYPGTVFNTPSAHDIAALNGLYP